MPTKSCGNSYDEWDANGCRNGHRVCDQCDQCMDWECDYWDAAERDDT